MKYYIDPCCRKRQCPKLLVEDGTVTIIDHYDRYTAVPETEFKAMAVAEINSLPPSHGFYPGPCLYDSEPMAYPGGGVFKPIPYCPGELIAVYFS